MSEPDITEVAERRLAYHHSETDPRQCMDKREHAVIEAAERARQADPVGLREALVKYGWHQHEWLPFPTKRFTNGAWRDSVEPEEGWDRMGVGRMCPDEETGECWCGFDALLASLPAQAVEPGPLDVERRTIDNCIDIVEQTISTMRAEDPDGELRSVQTGIAAREHVVVMLTGYRDSLSPDKQPKGAG